MSDSERLSANVPGTGSSPAYSPRPSTELLPPPLPPGVLTEALANERPPAYTPSPDPTGPHPMVAPMPLVMEPRRMPAVKHPKLFPVLAIRYAPHPEKLVFFTHTMEGNGLWWSVRHCRFNSTYQVPREHAVQFALSPDAETCALVRPARADESEGHRVAMNRSQVLELRLYHVESQNMPVFKKDKKITLSFSTILDPPDDPCDSSIPFRPMAFSADGTILAIAVRGHRIVLCSVMLAKVRTSLAIHMAEVTHIVFSRYGSRMASCSLDGIVRVTGPEGDCVGKMDQSSYQKGSRRAVDLAISHDGKRVVTVWGTRVVIWWPDTGANTAYDLWQKRLPDAEVWPLCLSPDCKLLGCRTEDGMDILDSHTGDVLLKISQPSQVTAAAFSPNGEVVTLGLFDGLVESWKIY